MSVNGVSTIYGIASLKIPRVSLHPWLIIKLSPGFLNKIWLRRHCDYVLNMSVKGASTAVGLALWKMQGLHGDIELSSNYGLPFYAKMVATTSLLCPKNERQWSVNDFWPCILEQARVVRLHWLIIRLSAYCLGKNASSRIVTLSQNERHRSVKDFWSCMLNNLMAMECRQPTMNSSAAFNGKDASDDIPSASYNWAPTQRQQFWWMLRSSHSDVLHYAVRKSSFTRSVFAIYRCIQLHNYACNVSQIRFFCL